MPDKDEKKTVPADHAAGEEVSTRDAQYSTGPSEEADAGDGTTTYYLRENRAHHVVVKGEVRELNRFGDKADLTPSQYEAFKDKFHTAAEYKGLRAGREAAAEAQAAELALEQRSQENKTPEETQAVQNDPDGTGKKTAAGNQGKPEEKK
jgi:hypothetical protein